MSRISAGVSAVRPRVPYEASTMPSVDDRSRSRQTERMTRMDTSSRVPEIPSVKALQSRFQVEGNNVTKAGTTSAVIKTTSPATAADVPEIRVQKGIQPGAQSAKSAAAQSSPEPESYFESTNHSQRFRHTRELFAKMEERSMIEKERRRQLLQRSKSPTRFPVSPPNFLTLSPLIHDTHGSLSPTSSTDSDFRTSSQQTAGNRFDFGRQSRPTNESSRIDEMPSERAVTGDTLPTRATRASSVDGLDSDDPFEPLSASSKAFSRSETNLGSSNDGSDMPSAKALMQHYEEVARKSSGASTVSATLPVRRRSRPSTSTDDGNSPVAGQQNVTSAPSTLSYETNSLDRRAFGNNTYTKSNNNIEKNGTNTAYIRQNIPEKSDLTKPAANVKPSSLSAVKLTNTVTDSNSGRPSAVRYGRPEAVGQTTAVSSSSGSKSPIATSSSKPSSSGIAVTVKKGNTDVTSTTERKSVFEDDDSVAKSIQEWRSRRLRTGSETGNLSDKIEELEKGVQKKSFEAEKPSWVTDRRLNSVDTNRSSDGSSDKQDHVLNTGNDSDKSGEHMESFGISLHSSARVENSSSLPKENGVSAVGLHTPAEKLPELTSTDDEKDISTSVELGSAANRRRSIELAEVPHFPKDSVLLGHSGAHSPILRSPTHLDESHSGSFTFESRVESTSIVHKQSTLLESGSAINDSVSGGEVNILGNGGSTVEAILGNVQSTVRDIGEAALLDDAVPEDNTRGVQYLPRLQEQRVTEEYYDSSDMANFDEYYWNDRLESPVYRGRYMEPVDENGVHILEDGNFFFEIEGLPEKDPEDDIFPMAKKPGRVRFSSAPMTVFSTYSVNEYDRKNEDIDPMAASAEYELEKRVEKMELIEVDLDKGSDGLGLSIIGMGVGADAGLEKLGIFIKTLTDGGAAARDGRIQVNDQIIEVDGKSLVGVTQAYAASVLRNTSGKVHFVIGREKDPSNSEVARLIKQSLDNDMRIKEERDRRTILQSQAQTAYKDEETDSESEQHNSPSYAGVTLVADAFVSPRYGSNESTPEVDTKHLYSQLIEEQQRIAALEAELVKANAKLAGVSESKSSKPQVDQRNEEIIEKLRTAESQLQMAQKESSRYETLLKESREQYVQLEAKLRAEMDELYKKYLKACETIKEFQQREKEHFEKRESMQKQFADSEAKYTQAINQLEARVSLLEGELSNNGQTVVRDVDKLSSSSSNSEIVSASYDLIDAGGGDSYLLDTSANRAKRNLVNSGAMASRRPPSTIHRSDSTSSREDGKMNGGDFSDNDVDSPAQARLVQYKEPQKLYSTGTVSDTKLLDNLDADQTVIREYSSYNSGQIVSAVSPTDSYTRLDQREATQHTVNGDEYPDCVISEHSDNKILAPTLGAEILLSSKVEHSSYDDRGQTESSQSVSIAVPDFIITEATGSPSIHNDLMEHSSGKSWFRNLITRGKKSYTIEQPKSTSNASKSKIASDARKQSDFTDSMAVGHQISTEQEIPIQKDDSFSVPMNRDNEDAKSDVSSSSQTSYDPQKPNFHGSEISGLMAADEANSNNGNVVLLVHRSRPDATTVGSSSSGITLVSKKTLPGNDYEAGSQENLFATRQTMTGASSVLDWTPQQVAEWLARAQLGTYAAAFMAQGIGGSQLLMLESSQMKSLVGNSQDRDNLKKLLKSMKLNVENERKMRAKEQKDREKLEKQARKKSTR